MGSNTTWTGTDSNDWNDPKNWDPQKVPDQNTAVTIGQSAGQITVPTNAQVQSITVDTGSTLIIN